MQGEAPVYAEDWVCRKIFEQHMHAKSILTIYPLQVSRVELILKQPLFNRVVIDV